MFTTRTRFLFLILAAAALLLAQQSQPVTGYDDTPMLPDGKWHVHDGKRPRPRVVTPGTASTADAPGKPPSDAVVLFDGSDLSKWQSAKDGPAPWTVKDGYFEVKPRAGDIVTKDEFGSSQLHVEWRTPAPPKGDSQGRSNSGIFLFGLYEVQVLDSFENPTYADGQASAVYGQTPPLVNASRRPGEWQVYDIIYTAPTFRDGKIDKPMYETVFHNGVITQNHTEVLGSTQHRILPKVVVHGPKGPIKLQDHGDPIRYRNIWIRPL